MVHFDELAPPAKRASVTPDDKSQGPTANWSLPGDTSLVPTAAGTKPTTSKLGSPLAAPLSRGASP